MLQLADFLATYYGRAVTSPNGLGGQCVDLIELWAAALGKASIPGNAVDLLDNALPTSWRKTINTPTNQPSAGDIVVWGPTTAAGIGPYGHTAICLIASTVHVITLDQNWPVGAHTTTVPHDYRGVRGWLTSR